MNILNAEFSRSITDVEALPNFNLPEAAFIGRSNVGKSSLLNSIVRRKNLALISSTPGKTKSINFFIIDGKWSFADLPGFGYASVSKQDRAKWKSLNLSYLENREELKLVILLVDSRHDPMQQDIALIEFLENTYKKNYVIVLTKCDKISKTAVNERKEQIENLVSQCNNCIEVLPYSSETGLGREHLLAILKNNIKLTD